MIFFYQKSENDITVLHFSHFYKFLIKNIVEGKQPNFDNIYLLPVNSFNNHLKYMKENEPETELYMVSEDALKRTKHLPCMIGNKKNSTLFRNDLDTIEAIESIYKQRKEMLSIVIYSENPFALGDSLVQASVFKDLYDQLVARGVECQFVSYKIINSLHEEFLYTAIFPELRFRYLPCSIADFFGADFVLTDANYASNYEDDMHDVFAKQLNFKLSENFTVNKTLSMDLNIVNKAKNIYKNVFNNNLPILVFNKESTTKLRTMPNHIAEALVNKLLESGKMNIVSFDRGNFLNISHERYAILSSHTNNIKDYLAFLEPTDGLISTDSGPVHAMSRMGKKTYTIYTSIDPKIREKYYPLAKSVYLETEEYKNTHAKDDLTDEEQKVIWSLFDVEKEAKKIIKTFKKGLF